MREGTRVRSPPRAAPHQPRLPDFAAHERCARVSGSPDEGRTARRAISTRKRSASGSVALTRARELLDPHRPSSTSARNLALFLVHLLSALPKWRARISAQNNRPRQSRRSGSAGCATRSLFGGAFDVSPSPRAALFFGNPPQRCSFIHASANGRRETGRRYSSR